MSITPETPGTNRKVIGRTRKTVCWGVVILALGVFLYFMPGFFQEPFNTTGQVHVYYMGRLIEQPACYQDEELYLPFDFIRGEVDPTIRWDDKNKLVIITNTENVFHFPLGFKEGLINLEPYSFTYPVIEREGAVYLPADPLREVYDLEFLEQKEDCLVRIHDLREPVQMGKTLEAGKLRSSPSVRSPWVLSIGRDKEISVLYEDNGWFWVETHDGLMGYLPKKKAELTTIKTTEIKKNIYQPWNPLKRPVVLTWEYAGLTTANPRDIGELAEVSVVSPTWFHLTGDGLVINRADKNYVRWAHHNGQQVWGLFDNSFDPELTHTFLNDAVLRIKAMKQILTYVDLYELDGINLDFENMFLKDKNAYVQFVRELSPLLHEKERMLTVDVTFHSQSENWSLCYDRKSLAQIADFIMVMAYDEHGSGSSKAGSVSSLPWVEKGLENILKEVPPEKLLLGVPFYTRLWTETENDQGAKKLTCRALSMEKAEEWIKEHGAEIKEDRISGQHYIEYKEGNATYKMWLEDSYSLAKRIELMKKYRLAGIAAWRRGFEKEEIWPALGSLVNKVW